MLLSAGNSELRGCFMPTGCSSLHLRSSYFEFYLTKFYLFYWDDFPVYSELQCTLTYKFPWIKFCQHFLMKHQHHVSSLQFDLLLLQVVC